jgi:chemotaxis protein CheC
MTLADLYALTDAQRDALCEVANIGAGHAATALSLMTNTKIMISVPTITIAPLEELAPIISPVPDDPVALVPMAMTGSLHGHTILAFPLQTAHRLAALMLRHAPNPAAVVASDLSDLEASALTEAGNILAGAYMTALSEFMRMTLLPSPPSLAVGPARRVLSDTAAHAHHAGGYIICVETEFLLNHVGDRLPGYFLLLPDSESLGTMLAAVRVQ